MVEFYRCELCGNMVALIKKGGGTLVCCGQNMTKLEANSTDAAKEKHGYVTVNTSCRCNQQLSIKLNIWQRRSAIRTEAICRYPAGLRRVVHCIYFTSTYF